MSLIGCGVMTGVGAALYSAEVQPGNRSRSSAAAASAIRSSWARGWPARRRSSRSISTPQTRVGQGVRRDAHRQSERWRSGRGDQGDHRRLWRQCTRSRPSGKPETLDDRTLVARSRRHLRDHRRGRARSDGRVPDSPNSSISAAALGSPGTAIACRRAISRCWPSGMRRASSIWMAS